MNHRFDVVKMTTTSIVGGGANYIAVASAAGGLAQQLNQTHAFLYLDLPIWMFFAAAMILAMTGSLASLLIDLMAQPPLSTAHLALNLILGFMTGIVGAFVLLPVFTAKPTMPLLLLTALSMSFLGTVLVRNIGELLRSTEIWQSIKTTLKEIILESMVILKDVVVERFKLLLAVFFGGPKR